MSDLVFWSGSHRVFEFANNHRSLQQIICLLVCVCAWRGPVPMVHDHESRANSQFQHEHSAVFHEGREFAEIVGMHWHLAFPVDITGEQSPARDEASPELPLFACASATQCCESATSLSMQLTLRGFDTELESFADIEGVASLPGVSQPQSFLQILLSELPLSTVTGVCLI